VSERVPTDAVIAFRLAAHHLTERASEDRLAEVVGGCGVQNSPPGSALLALHARVQGVTRALVDRAVAEEKSLLQTWCMRGAPFYVPTAEAAVFTTGVLPPTEEAGRHLLFGVGPSLDRLGLTLAEAVDLTCAEIGDVLAGRRLAIGPLGAALAERIARRLPESRRIVWEEEGPYAPGQPIGEAVVHFCLRILTLQGVVCFAPRSGNKAPFVLVEEWLGHPIAPLDPDLARAELLRRYLHSYGPSSRGDFAAWLGIRAGDTDPWWSLVEDELTRVEFGGPAWLLTADLPALRSAPLPSGVRLLPPRDPYTQLRDRATILDGAYHREVWRTVGDPGTVLADGRIAGIWRSRKSGRKLTLTVTTFGGLPGRLEKALRQEAEQVALLREASSLDVDLDTY